MKRFPAQQPGLNYLTEGGTETEVMYKHGFELTEFAMFPLLDDDRAVEALRAMFTAYLETAVRHGFGAIIGGLDYRASPDWARRIGYSEAQLADAQLRSIDFLRDVADPYAGVLPSILYAGVVGPWGDAYAMDVAPSADEAETYHGVQMATLAKADVDLVEALTFNTVAEAIGVARAGAAQGLPVSISFMVAANGRLLSGPTLREAIQEIDEATGDARPAFYGINCSHPHEFMPAFDERGSWIERVRCLRPNAALADKAALCSLDHLEAGDPRMLGQLMGGLASRYPHIDIWGGCCGTWDDHFEQIAANVVEARGATTR
jgi:S-methylmethionine-dependent homocysteine/selenocysteine methylase